MANSYTCIIMMHVIAALGRISIEMYNKKLHAVNNIQELSFNVVHCVMQHLIFLSTWKANDATYLKRKLQKWQAVRKRLK